MSAQICFALLAATALFSALPALADPITIPQGLLPGSKYRLVFVTSTGLPDASNSGDIDHYNSFVQSVANSVPELQRLQTTWRVIGATQDVSAIANIGDSGSGTAIYRLDGQQVADNLYGMLHETLFTDMSITEKGTPLPPWPGLGDWIFNWAYTGVYDYDPVWKSWADGCSWCEPGYDRLGPHSMVIVGNVFARNTEWLAYASTTAKDSPYGFYAISSELTVPVATPEPGAASLILTVALALAWRRARP